MPSVQLDLFADAVAATYAEAQGQTLTNKQLYAQVAERLGIDPAIREARLPVGNTGEMHNLFRRKVRWAQQSLKRMQILEHHADQKGVWSLSEKYVNESGQELHKALPKVTLIAFSTNLGMAIWGSNLDVTAGIDEPISLVLTSPPFFLQNPRAYGNPRTEREYVDFICETIEPILEKLAPGGSIVLNLGNSSFEKGSPARSIYFERLVVALHDSFGLKKMNNMPWHGSKPPGRPTWWVSKKHVQLGSSYEHMLWLCREPHLVHADNRRVLVPHTKKHKKFVESGGTQRNAVYGDGAYIARPGDFSTPTEGKIPADILMRGNRCADTLRARRDALGLGFPVHGAVMPLSVADFYVKFLTEPGALVYDPFSGSFKTAMAAEINARRWVGAEWMLDYARPPAERFRPFPGFSMSPAFESVRGSS